MIEFGAIYCIPSGPGCTNCIFRESCYACQHGKVDQLPVKKKQQNSRTRYFNYLIIRIKGEKGVYLRKRSGNDIWKNMYEFPMIETCGEVSLSVLRRSSEWKAVFGKTRPEISGQSTRQLHFLSHRKINAAFYKIESDKELETAGEFFTLPEIPALPVPRLIEKQLSPLSPNP